MLIGASLPPGFATAAPRLGRALAGDVTPTDRDAAGEAEAPRAGGAAAAGGADREDDGRRAAPIEVRRRRTNTGAHPPPLRLQGLRVRREHRDLTDAVATLPGVQVDRVGGFGSEAAVRVRATSPAQTAWALDGVSLRSPIGRPLDLEALPLGLLRDLALYRDGAPLGIGAEALGGAVDLRLGLGGPPALRLGGGSFGAALVEARVGWGGGEGGHSDDDGGVSAGVVAVRWLRADNDFAFRHDAGTPLLRADDGWRRRENNDVQRLGGVVAHRQRLGRSSTLHLRWLGDLRGQGLPGAAAAPALRARLEHQRHDAAAHWRGSAGRHDVELTLRGGLQHEVVADVSGELGPPRRRSLGVRALEASALWQHRSKAPIEPSVRVGAFVGRVEGQEALSGVAQPTSTLQGADLGVSAPWRLAGGWRLEPRGHLSVQRSERADDPASSGGWQVREVPWRSLPTLRVGLHRVLPGQGGLRLGVASARRAPHLLELHGDDGVVSGNSALRDEHALSIDFGADGGARLGPVALQGRFAASHQRQRDLIALQRTSPTRAIWLNIAAADATAVDASAELTAWGWLGASASYAAISARDRGQDPAWRGRAVPLVPASAWNVALRAERSLPGGVSVQPFGRLRWRAGRFADRANLVRLPPRARLDLGIQLVRGGLQLALRVDDLADAGDDDLVGFPLSGRAFLVTLTADTGAGAGAGADSGPGPSAGAR